MNEMGKRMGSPWIKGTNYSWFALAESHRSSQVRFEGISAGRRVDGATKNTRPILMARERINSKKKNLPNHSESTVVHVFAEEPDGCRAKVILDQKGKGNKDVCLPTFSIVRDLDGKLRPILQTRIKTHSTGPVQIRTRILEGTLCRGKSEFAPA